MINLIITIFGGLLIIAGFYAMSFGFATPPNFLFFLVGLCLAVVGLFLVVLFSSGIDLSRGKTPSSSKVEPKTAPVMKPRPKPVKVEKPVSEDEKKRETLDNIEKSIKPEKTIKPLPKIRRPKKAERPEMTPSTSIKDELAAGKTGVVSGEEKPQIGMSEIKAQRKIEKVDKGGSSTTPHDLTSKISPRIKKPVKAEAPPQEKSPTPKKPDMDKLRSIQPKKEDEFVKKRLDRLKESYIDNAKDIESIIDERLDSFKGTLGKLKSESKEPGIIWSFDAGDVQEAMMETISKANNRILMMYPWVRNIDVGILKKFMDIESRMIIQEASLDDDASVELLRLLIDKDVKIRTMPHVHTIAIVADDNNGLIISTDPIYESYEVGVVYKDQKSIEEIERLFEDAWEISQDVDLEIKS